MARVTGKSIDMVVERLNGVHYIPLLGDLFPRFWGDVQTVCRSRYLVHTDTGTFEVTEAEHTQVVEDGEFDTAGRSTTG
jgi:hypothetical protein